jgi:hypothetical protein
MGGHAEDVHGVRVPTSRTTNTYNRFTARRPLLDENIIEQRVAARLDRQQILTHWPPPTVTAVIEESVLYRTIGGRQVQREQMERLLDSLIHSLSPTRSLCLDRNG